MNAYKLSDISSNSRLARAISVKHSEWKGKKLTNKNYGHENIFEVGSKLPEYYLEKLKVLTG